MEERSNMLNKESKEIFDRLMAIIPNFFSYTFLSIRVPLALLMIERVQKRHSKLDLISNHFSSSISF